MSFTAWGFIYLGVGDEDPAVDRAVIERGGLRTTVVAVGDRTQAAPAAAELVADGAQSIELCGAFTASDVTSVRAATGGSVPVGAVRFDMDAVPLLASLFDE